MESNRNDLIPLRIARIIPEAEDAKSFLLEATGGQKIPYVPGQFLTFVFNRPGREDERRNYSISSIPVSDEQLQITVKRIPNGEYSRWLIDEAREGDILYTIGASGLFTLPDNSHGFDEFFFLAAGSGITPVYPIIKTLLHDHLHTRIILIYSNRTPEHAIFYHELKKLQDKFYDRFQIEFLFSSEKSVLHKRLGIYLLEKLLVKYSTTTPDKQLFYLCGPFGYMQMVTIVLRNNGVPAANIRKEIFNIEKPTRKIEPPDKSPHAVTANIDGREYRFEVQYPQTILQAAKARKIPLLYSCESGQCGTCAMNCTSGEVWMWHNDVLMEDEIANGRVLTCTGYPVNGDVYLNK